MINTKTTHKTIEDIITQYENGIGYLAKFISAEPAFVSELKLFQLNNRIYATPYYGMNQITLLFEILHKYSAENNINTDTGTLYRSLISILGVDSKKIGDKNFIDTVKLLKKARMLNADTFLWLETLSDKNLVNLYKSLNELESKNALSPIFITFCSYFYFGFYHKREIDNEALTQLAKSHDLELSKKINTFLDTLVETYMKSHAKIRYAGCGTQSRGDIAHMMKSLIFYKQILNESSLEYILDVFNKKTVEIRQILSGLIVLDELNDYLERYSQENKNQLLENRQLLKEKMSFLIKVIFCNLHNLDNGYMYGSNLYSTLFIVIRDYGFSLSTSPDPYDLLCGLHRLKENDLLSKENIDAITGNDDDYDVCITNKIDGNVKLRKTILIVKSPFSIYNFDTNSQKVCIYENTPIYNTEEISVRIHYLLNIALTNIFNLAIYPGEIKSIKSILDDLGLYNLLQLTKFKTEIKNPYSPSKKASLIVLLGKSNLLTDNNKKLIKNNQIDINAKIIESLIKSIENERVIFTQESFNKLVMYREILNHSEDIFFHRLPDHLLTTQTLAQVFRMCTDTNENITLAQNRLRMLANHLLAIANERHERRMREFGLRGPQQPKNRLNYDQSVHNRAVELSVAKSAKSLFLLYSKEIANKNLEIQLTALNDWANTLDKNNLQEKSAQDCLTYLLDKKKSAGNYQDKDAELTTKQVLALLWVAIHSKNSLAEDCTTESGKKAFIKALYEIERGYNFDANENDDLSKESLRICTSGTFTKLFEPFVSVLKEVQITFSTDYLVKLKLKNYTLVAAKTYLLKNNIEKENYIDKADVGFIWEFIKNNVHQSMYEEFNEFYNSNDNSRDYLNRLIDGGELVKLDENFFTDLEKEKIKRMNSSEVVTSQPSQGGLFGTAATPEDNPKNTPPTPSHISKP